MHFLGDVAEAADALIILDVTHWQIANRNLRRPAGYGLDALPPERIVELHVAGMRQGVDGFWHDSHDKKPSNEVMDLAGRLVRDLPSLKAVTFEHHPAAPEEDFSEVLVRLNEIMGGARPQ